MNLILDFIRKHWPAFAAILVVAAVVTWSYFEGVADGQADCQAKYEAILAERDRVAALALKDALDAQRAQANEAMAAERQHLQNQAKTETAFRGLNKQVKDYVNAKPDITACRLDAVGLRYWNSANSGGDQSSAVNP